MKNNYIFGYGSIIKTDNAAMTTHVWNSMPVEVSWVKRSWNITGTQWYTVLWVQEDTKTVTNGILIKVDGDIEEFDEREAMYNRISLNTPQVLPISWSVLPDWFFHAYIPKNIQSYWEQPPILQSYIDVVLSGCLDISCEFAKRFIKTTYRWWDIHNDRAEPLYKRAMKLDHHHKSIDSFLDAK